MYMLVIISILSLPECHHYPNLVGSKNLAWQVFVHLDVKIIIIDIISREVWSVLSYMDSYFLEGMRGVGERYDF